MGHSEKVSNISDGTQCHVAARRGLCGRNCNPGMLTYGGRRSAWIWIWLRAVKCTNQTIGGLGSLVECILRQSQLTAVAGCCCVFVATAFPLRLPSALMPVRCCHGRCLCKPVPNPVNCCCGYQAAPCCRGVGDSGEKIHQDPALRAIF